MTDYGVTTSGFIRKPFNAIESDIETKARELFGFDIDLSVYSPLGLFVKMLSWEENRMWQELEKTYYANWLDTAEGANLDRLVKWGGLSRKPAQKAIAKGVTFLGERDTYIRQGFVIETAQGVRYETAVERTIGDDEYSFTQTCEITQGSAIVTVLDSSIMEEGSKVEGEGVASGTTIHAVLSATSIELSEAIPVTDPPETEPVESSLNFHSIAAIVDCRALVAGKDSMVVSNSLVEVVSLPGDGITRVFNPEPSINGRDPETDSELRERYWEEGAEGVGSSVSAIKNAIYELDSVTYVAVFENTGLTTDEWERPPKSVECIVESDEMHDIEIAAAIFNTKPAGIATVGEISREVDDAYDPENKYEIRFNRPAPLNVFVKLTIYYNGSFGDLSQDEVKENIMNYISGVELGGYIQPWRIAAVNSYIEQIDDMSAELETSGYQEISSVTAIGHEKFVPETDCLLDPGIYTMDVTVNGALSTLSINIPVNAKWSDVIKSMNAVLNGAVAAILYGRIRITSNSHGTSSSILLEALETNEFLTAIENKWAEKMDINIKTAIPGRLITQGTRLELDSRELAKCRADYITIVDGNQ